MKVCRNLSEDSLAADDAVWNAALEKFQCVQPRRRCRRGCDGWRGCLLRNQWRAFAPRNGLPFGTRAAALLCPRPLFSRPLPAPRLERSRPAYSPLTGSGSATIAGAFTTAGWPGPPGCQAHLALFPGRRPSARERRMAPPTSRRCKRRAYCIRQLRGPGDRRRWRARVASAVRLNEMQRCRRKGVRACRETTCLKSFSRGVMRNHFRRLHLSPGLNTWQA